MEVWGGVEEVSWFSVNGLMDYCSCAEKKKEGKKKGEHVKKSM